MKALINIQILVAFLVSLSIAGTYFSKFSLESTIVPLHYGLSLESLDQSYAISSYTIAYYGGNTAPGVYESLSTMYVADALSINVVYLNNEDKTSGYRTKCFLAEETHRPSSVVCFGSDGTVGIVWGSKLIYF